MARRSAAVAVEDPPPERTVGEWANEPNMGGFEPIITTLFSIDAEREYADLERELEFSNPAAADYAVLAEALGKAEDMARRAHRLYANAVVAREGFEVDADRLEAPMREAALGELAQEKADGTRTKQITDADVVARISAMYPDEVRRLAVRRAKAKQTCEHMERFADLWRIHCRTMQVLVEKAKH